MRPSSQKLDIAYPPPDTEVYTYIDSAGSNFQECKACFLHLLANLFRIVSDEFEQHMPEETAHIHSISNDLAQTHGWMSESH